MCKLFGIVYFLLFIVKFVKCDYIQEDNKSASIEKSEETARNQQTENYNKTSDITTNDETLVDEPEQYDRSGRVKEFESAAEETNHRLSGETESTMFVDSLAKSLHDALSDENVFDDVAVGRTGAESQQEESTDSADPDTGEIFVYTSQQNVLSQDPVLDLKARTGRVDEDNKEERDDNNYHDQVSRIGHFPRGSASNMRSGYVAPDKDDDDWKFPDQQQRGIPTSGMNDYSFNYPNFNHQRYPNSNYRKSKIRPEINLHNSPRLSPLYESVKSREMFYPVYNSREVMSQTNSYTGNLMKSYFGLHYPNRPMYTARSREMCSSCNRDNLKPMDRPRTPEIYISPDDHGFRRSIQPVVQPGAVPTKTANGRSIIDHDPSAGNDYPLQIDHDENTELNRAHSLRSHEAMDPVINGEQYSKDIDGGFGTKIGPLTKVLMSLPAYNRPRNSPLLRMGLGGGSRSIL